MGEKRSLRSSAIRWLSAIVFVFFIIFGVYSVVLIRSGRETSDLKVKLHSALTAGRLAEAACKETERTVEHLEDANRDLRILVNNQRNTLAGLEASNYELDTTIGEIESIVMGSENIIDELLEYFKAKIIENRNNLLR